MTHTQVARSLSVCVCAVKDFNFVHQQLPFPHTPPVFPTSSSLSEEFSIALQFSTIFSSASLSLSHSHSLPLFYSIPLSTLSASCTCLLAQKKIPRDIFPDHVKNDIRVSVYEYECTLVDCTLCVCVCWPHCACGF